MQSLLANNSRRQRCLLQLRKFNKSCYVAATEKKDSKWSWRHMKVPIEWQPNPHDTTSSLGWKWREDWRTVDFIFQIQDKPSICWKRLSAYGELGHQLTIILLEWNQFLCSWLQSAFVNGRWGPWQSRMWRLMALETKPLAEKKGTTKRSNLLPHPILTSPVC